MRYTTLSKKYKVEIDKVRVNGYDAYARTIIETCLR